MKVIDLLKTENIIKLNSEDHLSHALNQLKTSHDSGFVFDDNGHYMGLINPYFCVIKSNYPANTKVKHCVHHAPKIHLKYDLNKVISLLIESKAHYLPVFNDKDEFIGTISARRVMSMIKSLKFYQDKIDLLLKSKYRPLITISEQDTLSKAHELFRTSKKSKLVVIDDNLKLKGVLSFYDLISVFNEPKVNQGRSRTGNQDRLTNQKVKNYYKKYVLTLRTDNKIIDVINLILNKAVGSVIIIDQEKNPIGIITTKDIFQYYLLKTVKPKSIVE